MKTECEKYSKYETERSDVKSRSVPIFLQKVLGIIPVLWSAVLNQTTSKIVRGGGVRLYSLIYRWIRYNYVSIDVELTFLQDIA